MKCDFNMVIVRIPNILTSIVIALNTVLIFLHISLEAYFHGNNNLLVVERSRVNRVGIIRGDLVMVRYKTD